MESVLSRMVEAARKKDLRLYIKQHYEYHQIYINTTKNKTLIEMLENLRHQAIWFLFSSAYDQENYEYNLDAHRKLLDLFMKRDTNGAEALVREHIMASYNKFLPFWRSRSEGSA